MRFVGMFKIVLLLVTSDRSASKLANLVDFPVGDLLGVSAPRRHVLAYHLKGNSNGYD
jgi:hypothetical protein